MNKHGQTLILFVILIPLIILLLAVVVDLGTVMSKKVMAKEVIRDIIKNDYNKDDEIIKKLITKNNIDIQNLEIIRNDKEMIIKNKMNVKSIFGSIIGIKEYKIKINIKGHLIDNKMILN